MREVISMGTIQPSLEPVINHRAKCCHSQVASRINLRRISCCLVAKEVATSRVCR